MSNTQAQERRYISEPVHVRADETGAEYFEGYAARFNSATDLGWFIEEIAPGAFDGRLQDDVRCLFNHEPEYVLGRVPAGTLALEIDAEGLRYRAKYNPADPDHVRVMEKVKRGDVSQSSFAFTILEETWSKVGDKDKRTITKIQQLYDVAPVTYPAYADTSVAARNHEQAVKKAQPEGMSPGTLRAKIATLKHH